MKGTLGAWNPWAKIDLRLDMADDRIGIRSEIILREGLNKLIIIFVSLLKVFWSL